MPLGSIVPQLDPLRFVRQFTARKPFLLGEAIVLAVALAASFLSPSSWGIEVSLGGLAATGGILVALFVVARIAGERVRDVQEEEDRRLVVDIHRAVVPGHPTVVPSEATFSRAEAAAERIVLDIDAAVLIGIKNSDHTTAEKQRLWKPYVGKWIRISGPVLDVSETRMFLANYITPITRIYELVLKFESLWSDRLSVIQKGSNVAILGCIGDFMATLLVLERCELISDATSPVQKIERAIEPEEVTRQRLEGRIEDVQSRLAAIINSGSLKDRAIRLALELRNFAAAAIEGGGNPHTLDGSTTIYEAYKLRFGSRVADIEHELEGIGVMTGTVEDRIRPTIFPEDAPISSNDARLQTDAWEKRPRDVEAIADFIWECACDL